MLVRFTFKPVKDACDFFIVMLFWLPVFIASNILAVAIPLWIAWNGVHLYWQSVAPIDFWLAVRFAFGINLILAIISRFTPVSE